MKNFQEILLLCTFAISSVCSFMCFLKKQNTCQNLYNQLKNKLLYPFVYCKLSVWYAFYHLLYNDKINFLFMEKKDYTLFSNSCLIVKEYITISEKFTLIIN